MTKKRPDGRDATMRNVNALKRRVLALELLAKDSNGILQRLSERQAKLEAEAVARGWPS